MKEPLPIITGSGAVFSVFLLLFAGINGLLSNPETAAKLIEGAAVLGVILSPIYNILFHIFWLLFTPGYQSIGYQRVMMKSSKSQEEVRRSFNNKLYLSGQDKKDNAVIEYARRLTAGYRLYLEFGWAIVISLVIFITAQLILFPNTSSLIYITLILFALIIFLFSFLLREKITQPELAEFEGSLFNDTENK